MRLDIVTNDAGERVRREHARDVGADFVVAIVRLVRLVQMHDAQNQAVVRQLETTHQLLADYALRAGIPVSVFFARRAVFLAGQLLKGSHATYDAALELGDWLERCGGAELTIARDTRPAELLAFAQAVVATLRGQAYRPPSPRIRLRAVNEAARLRGIELEDLDAEARLVRAYASAVVLLRRFFDDLAEGRYVLPRHVKRIAQTLVDLSAQGAPAFLGVTEVRNAQHDDAGRSVNAAILAVLLARELTFDKKALAAIAMAAMMHDVARPRALAAAGSGARLGGAPSRLSEDAEDALPAGTAAVLTALGRVNEASIARTVTAFEAQWIRRAAHLGPTYGGVRPATLHARIVALARRYGDLLTPAPGETPRTPSQAIGILSQELGEALDRTLLRALVAALGIVPAGTVVELAGGEVAEVLDDPTCPAGHIVVRVVLDARGGVLGGRAPRLLDLREASAPIVRVVSVDGWSKAAKALDAERRPAAPPSESDPSSDPSSPSRSAVVATEPRVPVAAPSMPATSEPTGAEEAHATPPPPASGAPTESRIALPSNRPSPFAARSGLVPSARGTLATTPLAHVLVYMLDHALGGSVVFAEPEGVEHVVVFRDGAPVNVSVARPTPLLGEELVAAGLLARAALRPAVEGARRLGVLLGEYLVGHDYVTRTALARALEAQAGGKVAALVNLAPETTYTFYRDVDLLDGSGGTGEGEASPTDPLNVILATVRAWHDRARIRATLARIAKHRLVLHPQSDPSTLALTKDERAVLDRLRREPCTTSQLFQRNVADDEVVSSLVYALAITRQFAFKGQKGPPMGGRGAPIPISVSPPPMPGSGPPPPPMSEPLPSSSIDSARDDVPPEGEEPQTVRPPPGPAAAAPRPAPSAVDPAIEAMTSFRVAEAALARGDVAQAAREAARAVRADPAQGDYRALLTWLEAMVDQSDAAAHRAIGVLTSLIDAAPTERALLYRGKLHKRLRRLREAVRDFERVVAANPKNREAASELRLLYQSRAR